MPKGNAASVQFDIVAIIERINVLGSPQNRTDVPRAILANEGSKSCVCGFTSSIVRSLNRFGLANLVCIDRAFLMLPKGQCAYLRPRYLSGF